MIKWFNWRLNVFLNINFGCIGRHLAQGTLEECLNSNIFTWNIVSSLAAHLLLVIRFYNKISLKFRNITMKYLLSDLHWSIHHLHKHWRTFQFEDLLGTSYFFFLLQMEPWSLSWCIHKYLHQLYCPFLYSLSWC